MKYNIVTISDIHWGVISPKEQLKSLEFIFVFFEELYQHDIHIDLLVIAGDYFDSKLPLNSQEAICAIQWFHRLFDMCMNNGTIIRIFQGTMDHDNDQLEVFRPLEHVWDTERYDDEGFFKIFLKTTQEETLPGLQCIYCPDELLTTSEYEEAYLDEMLKENDIGFFHGSFDVVYGSLLESKPEMMKQKNVIFRYDYWNKLIHGPLIAGHWHNGEQYDDLYYCGSPFRYAFNEDNPKGFLFIQYDTDTKEYLVKKILNPLASDYITFKIYSNLYNTKEDYKRILDQIKDVLVKFEESTLNHKLKIQIYLVDDKPENDVLISTLRQETNGNRNVKISIKNRLKEKQKKEESKKIEEKKKNYGFIYQKENKPYEIIHDFIQEKSTENVDIPLDFIKEKCEKYLKGDI